MTNNAYLNFFLPELCSLLLLYLPCLLRQASLLELLLLLLQMLLFDFLILFHYTFIPLPIILLFSFLISLVPLLRDVAFFLLSLYQVLSELLLIFGYILSLPFSFVIKLFFGLNACGPFFFLFFLKGNRFF